MILTIFLIILTIVCIVLLVYQALARNNVSLYAQVLSRAYLTFILIAMMINNQTFFSHPSMLMGGLSILAILLSDVIVTALYLFRDSYKSKPQLEMLITSLGLIQSKYYCYLENSQAGIYVIDNKGRFEYVNPAFTTITGYTKEQLFKMTAPDLVSVEHKSLVKKMIDDKMCGHVTSTNVKLPLLRSDKKVIMVNVVSYCSENGHKTITGNVIVVE